jgi:prepilin-type N-terminal cleavage/methylation domain-containing protein
MRSERRAFTLIELLVVLTVLSLLLSIALPTLRASSRVARRMISGNNQRAIAAGANLYSLDNNERYPDSVATIGKNNRWGWQEPTVLIGFEKRSPQVNRSVSGYLFDYIASASAMACRNAPRTYPYLRQAWEAGDAWDCPLPGTRIQDPLYGNYCLYWNYTGYLPQSGNLFRGPSGPAAGASQRGLLVSDYLCLGCSRHPTAAISCEKLPNAEKTDYIGARTTYVMDVWVMDFGWDGSPYDSDGFPRIQLQAAYADGHVRTYFPSDTERMQVSITSDGYQPYTSMTGPGDFFIPSTQEN